MSAAVASMPSRPSPLLLAPLLAALLLVCVPSSSAFSRRLLQSTCDLTCSRLESCITATCSVVDAGSKLVTLDVSGCKGDYVSWVCCASASCTPRACNSNTVGMRFANTTCNEAYGVSYVVPRAFVMMPIHLHDGRLVGNRTCTNGDNGWGPGQCCAGGSGNCGAISNVCDLTLDLSRFGPSPPLTCKDDTAFAQPGALDPSTTPYTGTSVPGYVPGQSNSAVTFTWQPLTTISKNARWGGFFTVPSPPVSGGSPVTYTTAPPARGNEPPVFACAGCAGNDKNNGHSFGGVTLSVTTYNSSYSIASCSVDIASRFLRLYTTTAVHLYASYSPLTSTAPGQWKPQPAVGPGSLPLSGPTRLTAWVPVQGGSRPANAATVHLACHLATYECV
ncbi:hypothetical protein GPECTOR_2g959 [Gonium pectorale]|uniref:Pherophorin domain-containing protein n=1 Tax=Gonium pectorale TaxID=33097 RepID=A0A150H1P6_GONPE|nr:hypothetical protein GPECTOR_2g959 [Gonium pectorale]|eukprot:KXZ56077.1 hypothetical protein GPECTOR_2g959 [Gonium pectorale]